MSRQTETGYAAATFWGLVAAGFAVAGMGVALLAGYLLGHFTHVRTKTVALRTVTQQKAAADAAPAASPPNTWSLPGGDLQNSRDVGGPINASNVTQLGVAWTVPISASGTFGSYAATPVVSGGVLYTQDLASNVYAINLATGKLAWLKKFGVPDLGPNGVTVAAGIVYGATEDSVFALRSATGEQLWSKKVTRNDHEGIDMAPGYNDGTVYVSTVPANAKSLYAGDGKGILWALNAETGSTRWKFDEVPKALWSSAHANINSGGGTWYPPTFDGKGNLYIGTGNPAPFPGTPKFPWGSSRPGPDLYTDSIVKLNAQTGRLEWYYQLTPHDVLDYDLQNSPILATVDGRQVVIDGGKAGVLIAVDAETGKLLWRRSVGVHRNDGNVNLEAEKHEYSKLRLPQLFEPGSYGGVESPLASNGRTVFAAVNNWAVKFNTQDFLEGAYVGGISAATGELVAVDEATGSVEWDKKLPSSPYGAATIANNVVFTTTFDGHIYAFDVSTGRELWKSTLPASTNAPVTVVGNTVITAGSFPQKSGQTALITAYRIGATGTLPSPTQASRPTSKVPAPQKAGGSPSAAAGGGIAIEADPTGLLKYSATQLTGKPGADTLTLTNKSPVEHDIVLVNSASKVVGQTPIFARGAKSFKAKLAPGIYTFYCSVPGHREAGMKGTLTIR